MITRRLSDVDHHRDYEWSADMFCEIVRLLWVQMQAAQMVPAHYRLHLPQTADERQRLIDWLRQDIRKNQADLPPQPEYFVFAKRRSGSYEFALDSLLQVMVAAWGGLGKKPVRGEPYPYAYAQRSHHLLWFLEHYHQNSERLYGRVPIEFFPGMLRSALARLCVPKGFRLVWGNVSATW